jgi:ParB-like chromosome segregation protein Spo0J
MLRFHAALADLMVPAATITPDPRNANNGDIDEIVASLLVNGCYRPVYASQETGTIIAGHHLYAALLELGAQMIPVMWLDGDDEAGVRIMLADNRIAALARMDEALLLDLLRAIDTTPTGLTGTGYDDRYLQDLTERILNEGGPQVPDEDLTHQITCPNCGHQWNRTGHE